MTVMKQPFRIYVDRLRSGGEEAISETMTPSFLDLKESDEILATKPLSVEGKAYVAGDFLILSLHIVAELKLKCALCNEFFSLRVDLPHFIHEEALDEIKHGVFDFGELVRETILLEIPFYPQCGGSECLNRESVEKYLKTKEDTEEEGYHPFQNIDI